MNINEIIKNRRIELDLTMKELADKVGVSEGTVSRWESGGISNMRRDKVALLSKILGIPLEVLMGWETDAEHFERNTVQVFNRRRMTAKEKRFLEKYRQLNDANKSKLETYADSLLSVQTADEELLAAHREKPFNQADHEHDMKIIEDL